MDDSQAAISKTELAVSATPEDHADQAELLNNLACMLSDRYNRTGSIDDLEAAISKAEQAVSTAPEDYPNQAGRLNNLAIMLADRCDRT